MKSKKMFSLIVVFMLLISAFSPVVEFASANELTGNDLGNIFTLEVFNVDGVPVVDDVPIVIGNDTTVTLRYGWELINHQAISGDFAQIIVPEAFKALTSMTGNLDVFNEATEEMVSVGIYTLNENTNVLTFVFNEAIVDLDVSDGFVQFDFEFDLSYFSQNVRQLIPFNDSLEKDVLVVVTPTQTSSAISKIGVPNSLLDANTITWTIDLMNTSAVSRLGIINDILDAGLELDLSSFKLTPLSLGYNGSVLPITSQSLTLAENQILETTTGFNVEIPEIKAYSGYRLQYKTTFTDFNKLVFANEATYIYNDNQEISAISTVSGLTRSNIIEKTAAVLNGTEIRWTIDVNKSNALLIDAVVQDILDAGLTLKEGSVQVNALNLVSGVWQVGAAYPSYTTNTNQQEITFNLGNIQRQAYRITYITTVEFLGNYKTNNTFVNSAVLKEGGVTRGGDTSDATIVRAAILSKSSVSNVTFTNKTIDWTINVNQAKHPISNWTLTDTLPSGLELVAGSLKVFNGAVDVSNQFNIDTSLLPLFSITPIAEDTPDVNTYTVRYQTRILDFTKNSFVNAATLEGDGITGTVSVTTTNSPPANSFAKTYINNSINYNTKTMSWRLTVNPTREALKTLKITDTFPNKGIRLIEDSLTVTLGGVILTEGVDYNLDYVTGSTNYKDGFIVEFTEKYNNDTTPISNTVVINFNTSFDPDLGIDANTNGSRIVNNSALFTATSVNNTSFSQTRTAQVTLRVDSWFNGKKEGRRVYKNQSDVITSGWVSGFDRLIEWSVYSNYLEENLTGKEVVITDTLAYGGVIDQSSIRILEYLVNSNGTTSLTSTQVDPSEYTLSIDVNGKLTITFDQGYDKRLAVVFLTSVPNQSLPVYTNNSTVVINEGTPLNYTASVNWSESSKLLSKQELVTRTGTNAFVDEEIDWLITLNESLSIIKNGLVQDTISTGMVLIEDSVSVVKVINGIEIPIDADDYDISIVNNSITATIPTVLSIQFVPGYEIDTVIRIKYKTVVVTDTGFINNRVTFSGDTVTETIVTTSQLTARQLSFAGGVANTRLGSIIVEKSDADNGDALVSTFELYYLINGEERVVEDKTFDTVGGVYRFNNLSYRTYYLREISTQNGYVILEDPITILLDSTTVDANRVRTVSVENIKTLVLEKTGSLLGEALTYKEVGDVINYTLVATNTGEETLNNVEIIDDKSTLLTNVRFYVINSLGETILDNVTNGDVTLAPTQGLVMVGQYAVTQNDIDDGSVENTAYAQATYRNGIAIISEEDDVVINADQDPIIEIVKRALSGQNFTEVNDVIEYEFVVTNTGNMTLNNVIITDDLVSNLVYQSINGVPYVSGTITLLPGDVLVAKASYSVTQLDLDRGEVLNIASTRGTDSNSTVVEDDDREDTLGVQEPSISIVKTVLNEDNFTSAGETIFYEFTVRNTGNVTLNNVRITDDLVTNIEYISINGVAVTNPLNIVLAPNEVLIARASYVVTQADMNQLEIINQASVTAKSPNNEEVSDDDNAYIEGVSRPDISIVKNATIYNINGIKLSDVQPVFVESTQEWIIYEIVATNTGNITLHNVSIEDERVDLINLVYTKIDKNGNEITGVTNGEVTLQPNEKLVLTARLNVTQQMINDDFIDNVASTMGYPENPNEPGTPTETFIEDEDEERVEVNQISTITLDKLLLNEGAFSEVGDIVQYRFIVTNTGNTTLTNVHLVDTLVDEITYVSINGEALVEGETSVTLQPNDVLYAVASYVITQEDLNAQAVLNTAQVTGTTPKDVEISDEDEALIDGVYDPKISVDKSMVIYNGDQIKANQNAVDSLSDWIMYEVVLVNIGNITLHNVGIVDDKEDLYDIEYKVLNSLGVEVDQIVINGQVTLQPNESLVMTAKLDVTREILDEGTIFNQAFGTAYPEDPNEPGEPGEEVIEADDEIVIDVDQEVRISLEKSSIDVDFYDSIDTRIYYLFKIVNEGNTTISNVMLLDDKIVEFTEFKLNGTIVDASEEGFTLNSEDELEIIGYTVTTQEDIERGFIYNEAEVVGKDVFDENVTDTDNDTVEGRKYNSVSLTKTNVIYDENDEIIGQYSSVNDVIVYNIKAVNTGNTIAYDVNVLDKMFVKMTGIVVTHLTANDEVISTFDYEGEMAITLLPGEQIVVVGNYQITEDDLLNERVFNQATAVFKDVDGEVLGDSEDETVSIGLVNLSIKKVDESDTLKVLRGAQFELRDVATNQKWTITTNDQGIALFSKLEFGQYELREIVAPKGYVLSDEIIVITIDEDSDTLIEIEFTNEAMLPNTSDSRSQTGLLLLLLGMLLVKFSSKNSKKKAQG